MSCKPQVLANIDGASKVTEWFGEWPSFHDAEILEINLHRHGESQIKLHTGQLLGQVDPNGCQRKRYAIVTFRLQDVSNLSLDDFSQQNVISGLDIEQSEEGLQVILHPNFGVCGSITAGRVSIDFEPIPASASSANTKE
jgi:hypothetical protein